MGLAMLRGRCLRLANDFMIFTGIHAGLPENLRSSERIL